MEAELRAPRPRREHLALLDHAERLGALGTWAWTPRTGEIAWSDNCYRLFGLKPGSVCPSTGYLLAHVHPADCDRVEGVLSALAAGAEVPACDFRVVRDDALVRHVRATIAFVDEDGPRRLVGALQDISRQDSVARKLAAHAAVSTALDEWRDFEQGARDLLAGLATAMSLPFGVLWVTRGSRLQPAGIWHLPSPPFEVLADATLRWLPGRRTATLGSAWLCRKPVVSDQPEAGAGPERAAAVRGAGFRGRIAIPAVAVDETLAVIELFSLEHVEESDSLLRALNGIGHEIGYFLGQRRGELVAPLLSARELQVLQLAARALTAIDIADEMHISPATVKRHFERAYASLGVSDRAAAVAQAMRQGLID